MKRVIKHTSISGLSSRSLRVKISIMRKQLVVVLSICFIIIVTLVLFHTNQYNAMKNTVLQYPPISAIRDYLNHQNKTAEFLDSIKGTNRSITVVTAYFNIGRFPKGNPSQVRTSETYNTWMKTFQYLKNPVVFYTDDKAYADFFVALRKNSSLLTEVIHINRSQLWAFKIIPKIKKIYSTPGYPRHYPNTISPEYTSLTHSKQQVLADTVNRHPFDTEFYCWLDAGYFRDNVYRERKFWMEVPDDFNKSRIGVTRVFYADLENVNARNIILMNINWIGGGLFLGKPEVILKFHDQYKKAVMRYLSQGIMNVEQHILYAMYTKSERKKYPIDVEVQLYIPGQKRVRNGNPWFYLGYLMYREDPK
ncbi:uncharacterized protein LOC125659385 isoform X2 [Ostrea edulis]|uniref:uncharacterized protein LOC125659385 isoform X2 n=1 Tax=Ostrea edulis TaxID=37623 RepID=UPI0024AEC390|nr:uncharacterized protein LOC125659385 isoform X2 [Ostrea edulis]